MKRVLSVVTTTVLLILTGCQSTPNETMGACPCCAAPMAVGHYCKKCNAVASDGSMAPQPKTGKLVKAGTYCPECNAFIFPKEQSLNCPDCGKTVTRGTFCPKQMRYHGCFGVKFDEKKEKPVCCGKKRGGLCGRCHNG